MKEYYVDYRFIVRAKDEYEAAKKVDELIHGLRMMFGTP